MFVFNFGLIRLKFLHLCAQAHWIYTWVCEWQSVCWWYIYESMTANTDFSKCGTRLVLKPRWLFQSLISMNVSTWMSIAFRHSKSQTHICFLLIQRPATNITPSSTWNFDGGCYTFVRYFNKHWISITFWFFFAAFFFKFQMLTHFKLSKLLKQTP